MDFTSIHNYHEHLVINKIRQLATIHDNSLTEDELIDAACIALNELPPRYVRHDIDTIFYLTSDERSRLDQSIIDAVTYAVDFIQAHKTSPLPNSDTQQAS